MKKIFLLLVMIAIAWCGKSQNVQLHYDLGSELYNNDLSSRPPLTSTVEMFHADKWGSTFFFIDMDYNSNGVQAGYWEISREISLGKNPFSIHVEYNGGTSNAFSYKNAYLTGITYTYNSKDFSRGFTFTPMYKYIQKADEPNNFQLTATWYIHLDKGFITLDGFADFWREHTLYGRTIFLSEPQIWFNLNKLKGVDKDFNLSLGSETEFSNNFGGRDGFYAIPTLAFKWTFK